MPRILHDECMFYIIFLIFHWSETEIERGTVDINNIMKCQIGIFKQKNYNIKFFFGWIQVSVRLELVITYANDIAATKAARHVKLNIIPLL